MRDPNRRGEDDGYEFKDQPSDGRDDTVSPVVVGAAVLGMVVGLFLWGSLAFSAVSGISGIFDDGDNAPVAGETVDGDSEGAGEDETPAVEETEEPGSPTPEPTATLEVDATRNRQDCDAIRGTDYRSPEERQWFLANCL